MIEQRFSPLEYRADTGRVEGVALRYGDTASIGGAFRERFEAGAFGEVGGLDIIARLQHERGRPIGRTGGGGLELADSAAELRASLTLPNTRDGADAAELLRTRILRGWSVEFRATREKVEAGTRIIEAAELRGLGLVDEPAYGDSLAQIAERCQQCTEGRGQALAARLERAISAQDGDRDAVLSAMGTAAGIAPATVSQILRADIDCPPLARLRGFARALGVPVGELVAAAERDGCQYSRRRFML